MVQRIIAESGFFTGGRMIIPSNAREEYVRLLQSKGKDEAQRMIYARLIMSKGRKWWNENKLPIKQELEELEGKWTQTN